MARRMTSSLKMCGESSSLLERSRCFKIWMNFCFFCFIIVITFAYLYRATVNRQKKVKKECVNIYRIKKINKTILPILYCAVQMFYGMTFPFGPYQLDPSEETVRADYFLIDC